MTEKVANAPPLPPDLTDREVAEEILSIPMHFPHREYWWIFFAFSVALFVLFLVSVGVLFFYGVGVWGTNIPVNWSFAILNYIWWLGLGHAGTFISALLLLLNQQWRNSLNRFAEAMTLFAVVCAGIYPILHLGRPWLFYWMAPYPNPMGVWPQFRSPLAWDFFAVLTYLLVSVAFWYIGAIPDFAGARDRARKRRWQVFFGLLALGWRGSAVHWARWRQAYRTTAALAIPLVVSVSSEYSFLLDLGVLPGWHSTVFPPYFVAGAVFSGFALVAIITVTLRPFFGIQNLVRPHHLDMLGRMILATGLITAYGYVADIFTVLYGGGPHETQTLLDRMQGEYAWSFWGAIFCNVVTIQALWWRGVRQNPAALFLVSLFVVIGMWLERYMILITGLYRDFLVSSWGSFSATFWEWSLFAGTIGLFLVPFCLFVRFLPAVSAFEEKEVLHRERTAG